MAQENLLQQAVDLTNRVVQVTSGINLPRGNHWHMVVTVGLSQANERFHSICILLDKGYWDSAVILTRSLFELAVNLSYISKDITTRLPQYLSHGGIPLTDEEAEELQRKVQELQREFEERQQLEVKGIVPTRAWKSLREMCLDLGSNWLATYETFYRFVSVPTHAGSFTLGANYVRLLDEQPPSAREKAEVLITALDFHLEVAEITAGAFPEQITLEEVENAQAECQQLWRSLAELVQSHLSSHG